MNKVQCPKSTRQMSREVDPTTITLSEDIKKESFLLVKISIKSIFIGWRLLTYHQKHVPVGNRRLDELHANML